MSEALPVPVAGAAVSQAGASLATCHCVVDRALTMLTVPEFAPASTDTPGLGLKLREAEVPD